MASFIPTRLHRLKVFESVTAYSIDGSEAPYLSTANIETQISEWLDKTQNLIVSVGSQALTIVETREIRSLAVIYVPAVDRNDNVFGLDPMPQAFKLLESTVGYQAAVDGGRPILQIAPDIELQAPENVCVTGPVSIDQVPQADSMVERRVLPIVYRKQNEKQKG